MIKITNEAKEYLNKVREGGYVTLSVKGGGCSGFQYVWGLSTEIDEEFTEIDDILLLDRMAEMYVLGSEIDYVTELGGSFLKVVNPTAKNSCGCGESFGV
jgi:iron-sulfur cluster assembly accessory protein|tara:strand:+ start:487 stop:786 length:300 start_codon:yes stop_codon:yes gene_type:complete